MLMDTACGDKARLQARGHFHALSPYTHASQ